MTIDRSAKIAFGISLLAVLLFLAAVILAPPRVVRAATGGTCTVMYSEVYHAQRGAEIARVTYACTGLTASTNNTVAFPATLPRVPRRVWLTPVGNAAMGVIISLDTSQGAADPSGQLAGGYTGVSASNLYVYIGAGTQFIATIEY
jgi:hypothetical protein